MELVKPKRRLNQNSMIVGVGTDIVEIERIKKALDKHGFSKRFFTEEEQKMSGNKVVMLADNFAVKEAVSKALGTGVRGFVLKDIEVLRDELGKPYVNLYGGALDIYNNLNAKNLQVSISNTDTLSQAICIIEN